MIELGTRFRALVDFYSDETQSHYVRGLGYTADNEKLARLVEQWLAAGKVELGGDMATLTGKG